MAWLQTPDQISSTKMKIKIKQLPLNRLLPNIWSVNKFDMKTFSNCRSVSTINWRCQQSCIKIKTHNVGDLRKQSCNSAEGLWLPITYEYMQVDNNLLVQYTPPLIHLNKENANKIKALSDRKKNVRVKNHGVANEWLFPVLNSTSNGLTARRVQHDTPLLLGVVLYIWFWHNN